MKTKKGVTLVELLLVVLILAAMMAIAIPRILSSRTTAEIKCHENIGAINSAIRQYNEDKGFYPEALSHVTESTMYFPNGRPTCPVHSTDYSETLGENNNVDTTNHDKH